MRFKRVVAVVVVAISVVELRGADMLAPKEPLMDTHSVFEQRDWAVRRNIKREMAAANLMGLDEVYSEEMKSYMRDQEPRIAQGLRSAMIGILKRELAGQKEKGA